MGIRFLKSEASKPGGVKLIVLVKSVKVSNSRSKIFKQRLRYSLIFRTPKNSKLGFSGYLRHGFKTKSEGD
jgi:hypothetical protein